LLGRAGMVTAGSLQIETFEGSRPRLRRTRQGYGRSIDRRTSGTMNLKPLMASLTAEDVMVCATRVTMPP
jgi:hypothetical protein